MNVGDRLEISILAFIFLSCTTVKTGAPIQSLCFLDFEAKTCWVNKAEGKGFTFDEMAKAQAVCRADKVAPCWYSLTSPDLKRLSK